MMRELLELVLVVTRWKLNPKNFGPNIKSIKFLRWGKLYRVGRVSGNNKIDAQFSSSVTENKHNDSK